ncbi:metallopeptidase [soil metagenome]
MNPHPAGCICALAIAIALVPSLPGVAAAAPAVTNHEDGSTVRYPVVLLRGTTDPGTATLELRNTATDNDPADSYSLVHDGRFKSLVKLAPGENTIGLRTGPGGPATTLHLTYQPPTNPHYVRLIWMTDRSGDTTYATPADDIPQDYAARLRTAALLMQTFTAERFHDLGYPRQTFSLETDKSGDPIIHTLKAPESADHYYNMENDQAWWGSVHRWLDEQQPDPMAKNLVLAAFTRKDSETGRMRAHTALGGGRLGLFGSGSVFSWPASIAEAATVFMDGTMVDPARVHDDSAGRGTIWGLASTTIGATLHEMGHTFDLPHCKDSLCIMTRGFDRFNRVFTFADPPSRTGLRGADFSAADEAYFAPISASYLRWSRWFQPDRTRYRNDDPPEITWDARAGAVTVTSRLGVRWVGLWTGSEVAAYLDFPESAAKEVELSRDEISALLEGAAPSAVTAIADNGRSARISIP